MNNEFDLVVIGSGPGGYVGAIRASQLGLKVAVIEKDKTLGGTCLNVGCIPSKALLESSEHYHFLQKNIKEHGINCENIRINLDKFIQRKTKIVSELTQGIQFLMKKNKISVFEGLGYLKSKNEVEVRVDNKTKEILKTKNILLATGSSSIELPFAPFDKKVIISSTEALSFSQIPKSIIVIGGGYIGLELGSVWNRLGTKVSVIEKSSMICPSMDQDISKKLQSILKEQGIDFYMNSSVEKIEKSKKLAKVNFKNKDGKIHTLEGEKILICVGRKPYTKDLGLENVKITKNKLDQIEVNNEFKTSVNNIYAIGDVIKGPMLAHKAEEEGIAVAEIIANGFGHVNYETVPGIIYTHPEAASVGKTEEDLKKQNIDYKLGTFPFLANGRAKALGSTDGFVKILADKKTDKILGIHIIGNRAGDLIAEAVIAMEFGSSSEDLARSFHAHPTLSEVIKEAALKVNNRAIHL